MKIASRGQLIELINDSGVETFPVKADSGKRIVNSIIHCKKKDEFYRVVWGEVKDDNKVSYLWYDEQTYKVKLDNASGLWLTKEETKQSIEDMREPKINADIKKFALYNIEDDLLFINSIQGNSKDDEVNSVQVVGGRTGKGKTQHVIREAAESIKKDQSIIYFSTEELAQDILSRLIKVLADDAYTKFERRDLMTSKDMIDLGEALHLVAKSKMTIHHSYAIDDNFILEKMSEVANSENGLDLVIIDSLKLPYNPEDHAAVIAIHKEMDKYSQKFGCKVIITTQLNRSL